MEENVFRPQLTRSTKLLDGVNYLLLYSDKYMGQEMHLEPAHIHTSLEIFYNEYSDVSFLVNGTIRHVGYGDAVVSRANDVHVCIYEKYKHHKYYCLWIDAPKDSKLYSFFNESDFCAFYTFDEEVKKQLSKLFSNLYFLDGKEGVDLEKATTLLNILCLFKTSAKKDVKIHSVDKEFENVLDYINKNFANITNLSQIAQQTYLSQATINRLFKKHTGESPKKYLESVKLSNAAKLLKSGANVTEACFESGFSNSSYFISVFKKRFLTTPHKYRELK